MKNNSRYNSAFSLMEVLLALSIFIVGVIGVVQIFPAGLKLTRESKKATIASHLGQSQIEFLESKNYDELTVGTFEAKHRLSADSNSYLYPFQRQTVINYVNADLTNSNSDIGLKKIVTTVFWQEEGEKNVDFAILITKR